jgi:hypothetical protein
VEIQAIPALKNIYIPGRVRKVKFRNANRFPHRRSDIFGCHVLRGPKENKKHTSQVLVPEERYMNSGNIRIRLCYNRQMLNYDTKANTVYYLDYHFQCHKLLRVPFY